MPCAGHTARILRDNADTLEDAEAVLHRSADASPRDETTRRLHQLGDAVTAEAHTIQDRAERLDADTSESDTAAGNPSHMAGPARRR
ncbi:MAG TPA: hypothetical protein VF657_03455 [Actinoplanes sp.]